MDRCGRGGPRQGERRPWSGRRGTCAALLVSLAGLLLGGCGESAESTGTGTGPPTTTAAGGPGAQAGQGGLGGAGAATGGSGGTIPDSPLLGGYEVSGSEARYGS